jgi:hypothetical protein
VSATNDYKKDAQFRKLNAVKEARAHATRAMAGSDERRNHPAGLESVF